MRGRYLGVSAITWSLALIVGPGLGMKLYSSHAEVYWLACGVTSLIAAALILPNVPAAPAPTSLPDRARG
jgi:MFS family permease